METLSAQAVSFPGNLPKRGYATNDSSPELREAIRLNPHLAAAHCNLGTALSLQGKQEEAIAEFRAAIRLKPDLAEAHCNLGIALKKQGKLDEAISEYRTAIQLQPEHAGAHYNLGLALVDQGKLDEAVAEYRKARDNAQPGSQLAQLIERALAAVGGQTDRRERARFRIPSIFRR